MLAFRNDAAGKIDKKLLNKVNTLVKDFEKVRDVDFEQNHDYIKKRLGEEILLRFYPSETVEKQSYLKDKTVLRAISIINNGENSKILRKTKYN